jgi:hypothetical protein
MPDPGTAARRLAASALTALALTAAAGVVDNPAPASPPSVPSQMGPRDRRVGGAARLPAGEGADPPDPAGPVLGVVGGRPAGLVPLDPRTLEPLDGRRVVLPSGTSGYARP